MAALPVGVGFDIHPYADDPGRPVRAELFLGPR